MRKISCLIVMLITLVAMTGSALGSVADSVELNGASGTSIACELKITNGVALGAASVELPTGFSAKITLYLQKKSANGTWTVIAMKSVKGTGTRAETSVTKNVESGTYRARAVVITYDEDGNQKDVLSHNSTIKEYK